MPSVLHPCPTCGHETMDECWEAGRALSEKHRRLCVDCHCECLPRVRRRGAKSPSGAKSPGKSPDPRLLFAAPGAS